MASNLNTVFDRNLERLTVFGWWKIKSKSRWIQRLYKSYQIFSIIYLLTFLILQYMDLGDSFNDLTTFSTSITNFSIGSLVMLSNFALLQRHKNIAKLQQNLSENFQASHIGHSESDQRVLNQSKTQMLRITRGLFGLATMTMVVWTIMPLIDVSDERKLPLRLWLPYDWSSTPTYEIFYFIQITAIWTFGSGIVCHELIYIGFVIQILSQYDILKTNLQILHKFRKGNNQISRCKKDKEFIVMLKKNVIHHRGITRSIKEMQLIYETCLTIRMITFVPLLSLIGYNILIAMKTKSISLNMVTQISFGGSVLFDAFVLCFYGDQLIQKGQNVCNAVYECSWYTMDRPTIKLLTIIMSKAQSSPGLIAVIFPLNFKTFLQALATAYNILAVLNQVSNY